MNPKGHPDPSRPVLKAKIRQNIAKTPDQTPWAAGTCYTMVRSMGGIGQPKTKRFMFATDGRPFEEVMDAVSSNRMDPEGRAVWLVLERPE